MPARLILLAALAAVVAALVLGGRLLGRRRTRRLAGLGPGFWRALGAEPDGRVTVVVISAPGCRDCEPQKRALAELATRGPLRVVGIDAGDRPEVARALGVLTAPTTIVLDRGGGVAVANHGFAPLGRLAAQVAAAAESA